MFASLNHLTKICYEFHVHGLYNSVSLAVLQTFAIIKVINGTSGSQVNLHTQPSDKLRNKNGRNKGEKMTQGRGGARGTVMTQIDREAEDGLSD